MNFLSLLSLGLLLGIGVFAYLLWQKFKKIEARFQNDESQKLLTEWLKSMQGSLDETRKTLGDSLRASSGDVSKILQENSKQLNERLDKAAEVIGGVQKNLGAMQEASVWLKSLHETLLAPKLRGNVGEQILYDLLKQHFPNQSVKLQHTFRSGEKVDALIVTADGAIPVDSKFPLESFKRYTAASEGAERERLGKDFARDVRKHVDDIARKYILPEEGTMERAIMYVPSEPVAYEIITNFSDLVDYAHGKNVVLASPNLLTQFLKVILLGFERQQVAGQVNQILNALKAIKIEAGKFGDDLRLTVKHVTNAKNAADETASSFSRLEGKIFSVQLTSPEPKSLLEE